MLFFCFTLSLSSTSDNTGLVFIVRELLPKENRLPNFSQSTWHITHDPAQSEKKTANHINVLYAYFCVFFIYTQESFTRFLNSFILCIEYILDPIYIC